MTRPLAPACVSRTSRERDVIAARQDSTDSQTAEVTMMIIMGIS